MFYHAEVPESSEKRTASYARSSTNVRATESQLEACRLAEHLGFDVTHEFIDERISGTTRANSRPGTAQLMARPLLLDVLRTIGVKLRKVGFLRVDYADGTTRTFRFARGDGAPL